MSALGRKRTVVNSIQILFRGGNGAIFDAEEYQKCNNPTNKKTSYHWLNCSIIRLSDNAAYDHCEQSLNSAYDQSKLDHNHCLALAWII